MAHPSGDTMKHLDLEMTPGQALGWDYVPGSINNHFLIFWWCTAGSDSAEKAFLNPPFIRWWRYACYPDACCLQLYPGRKLPLTHILRLLSIIFYCLSLSMASFLSSFPFPLMSLLSPAFLQPESSYLSLSAEKFPPPLPIPFLLLVLFLFPHPPTCHHQPSAGKCSVVLWQSEWFMIDWWGRGRRINHGGVVELRHNANGVLIECWMALNNGSGFSLQSMHITTIGWQGAFTM